jgi:poly(3-hydroxybutyrate) depolymerase
LTFTPDFIQGGSSWNVVVTAVNEHGKDECSFTITVQDTISPPLPTIKTTVVGTGFTNLEVVQVTDAYLDSPGHAGRSFGARVFVPSEASPTKKMPVQIHLHGYGSALPSGAGSNKHFRIYPHDPMNSYWWGYGDGLPSEASTTVPNYTQRRVLHLLEWVLRTHPGADPERVYVGGGSMGGAGSATLGLLYARHFAYIDSTIGQMVPRNHRPDRVKQLQGLWGSPSDNLLDGTSLENGEAIGVWDRLDLTRVLRDMLEAKDQFVFTKHGKDDSTIHFGAVIHPSPTTQQSYYETVQGEGLGHYAIWDEGGHGTADPVMGAAWWDDGWSLIFDSTSYLRRDLAFPAFSKASHDWNPGDGQGNGKKPWNNNSGYAGTVTVAGDTGWNGDIAGAFNRFLRWDATAIVDEPDRFELPLFLVDGTGKSAPKAGYPSTGDLLDKTLPVLVDVTPRRVQQFKCVEGETIHYTYDGESGVVKANADGSVTIPQIPVSTTKRILVLGRAEP